MLASVFSGAISAWLVTIFQRLWLALRRMVGGKVGARPSRPSAWLSGRVRRWHTHRHFASTDDWVDAHSARVAILMLQLWPDVSVSALSAAITHDLGEYATGDMSGPMKRQHPTLYSILSTFEARAIGDLGLPPPELDVLDDAKLKLCDRFDAYLWARLHRPDYVGSSAHWIAHLAWLRKAADALGVRPKFEEVLRGAL